MNPLFKQYGNKGQGAQMNPAKALLQHINSFKGNPIEILQEQYNEMYSVAQGIAQKMMAVLPRR